MTFKVTDNQYGRLSYWQLGFLYCSTNNPSIKPHSTFTVTFLQLYVIKQTML